MISKVRVLLVDDSIETLDVLKAQLKFIPIVDAIFQATTVAEAWKYLVNQRNKVNIVLIDIHLGQENGFELCSGLATAQPDLYRVMCSIDADPITKNYAYQVGANDFIEKPVAMDELRRILGNYEQVRF